MVSQSKTLLILDLDETLIHATSKPKDSNWSFEIPPYKIYKRPKLDFFLKEIKEYFDVAVWSSASDDYVQQVVEHIFPIDYELKFVWGRSKCTRQIDYQKVEEVGYCDPYVHAHYCKVLKKVKKKGYASMERMLIVDDTPFKSKYNYGNAIYSSEFTGDIEGDKELELLLEYLITLKDVTNVRTLEKRGWNKN